MRSGTRTAKWACGARRRMRVKTRRAPNAREEAGTRGGLEFRTSTPTPALEIGRHHSRTAFIRMCSRCLAPRTSVVGGVVEDGGLRCVGACGAPEIESLAGNITEGCDNGGGIQPEKRGRDREDTPPPGAAGDHQTGKAEGVEEGLCQQSRAVERPGEEGVGDECEQEEVRHEQTGE